MTLHLVMLGGASGMYRHTDGAVFAGTELMIATGAVRTGPMVEEAVEAGDQ